MRLHCLVKLKIRVFCENFNAGKAKLKKCYLLTLILLTDKVATFWHWHHVMANLIRKTHTKLYQHWPRFVKDMTKHFGVFFRFTVPAAVYLQNSQGRVEILNRWGGKRLHFCTTNLLGTTCTKFYHNWSGFVDCILKRFWCVFFGSQCSHAVVTCAIKLFHCFTSHVTMSKTEIKLYQLLKEF